MSEVKLFRPNQLDARQWQQLQIVGLRACEAAFADGFDPEAYMDWDDFDRFAQSHLDPNSEVGRRFNANQEYHHPRVAVAFGGREPISWAYSAHNVSGGGPADGPHDESPEARLARFKKRASVVKNYLHFREDYTLPEFQDRGVAHAVGKRLLRNAIPLQPVAAYIYPDIYKPGATSPLEAARQLGFVATGETSREVAGSPLPTRMVRVQAPTALGVWRKL